MSYYAEYARYGIRVSNCRTLYRFGTKAERDAWVDADEFENDYHREAVFRDEARRRHPEAFSEDDFREGRWQRPWDERAGRWMDEERARWAEYPTAEVFED